jgi:hypothetical protein
VHGNDCPPALKLVAAIVLLEITAFLREAYQNIPKASRMSHKEKHANPWEHHQAYKEANRRWSMALSSMGHSQTSAQSLQSIAGEGGERKISFVLHEPDNESEGSSNTTLTMQGEENAMGKKPNQNLKSLSIKFSNHVPFFHKFNHRAFNSDDLLQLSDHFCFVEVQLQIQLVVHLSDGR